MRAAVLTVSDSRSEAEDVSGDFFSVSALSDSEAGIFICDVAGHGVRAALVTAMIRALAEELNFVHRREERHSRRAVRRVFGRCPSIVE